MKTNKRSAKPLKSKAFSLIEMLVVLTIIAILLTIAIPSSDGKVDKIRIRETIKLISLYKDKIAEFYTVNGVFPESNEQAGIPEPEKIIGNYLSAVEIKKGGFHLLLGNKISSKLQGKTLTIRPVFVPESLLSPISWICGYDAIPEGMESPTSNNTDIEKQLLPLECL
ncbi:hypothetical protein LCGC14_2736090 [marine sediment metagenome]|uniref:Type II secretion system protein GspG C-terminal domain-containing protein n=1 Tax=marine sediment metagenome TaxID=412755 RepID=A0A0F8Z5U0_9ZZZZ